MSRNQTGVIFVFISVVLTTIAFVYYQYGGYTKTIKPATQTENPIERKYTFNIPDRGWYDTGIWVTTDRKVVAYSEHNPFILTVDSARSDAQMIDTNQFVARLYTTSEFLMYQDTAQVDSQGKVYIYSDYMQTIVVLITMDSQTVQNYKKQASSEAEQQDKQSSSNGWSWFTYIFIFVLSLIIIVVGGFFLIDLFGGSKPKPKYVSTKAKRNNFKIKI